MQYLEIGFIDVITPEMLVIALLGIMVLWIIFLWLNSGNLALTYLFTAGIVGFASVPQFDEATNYKRSVREANIHMTTAYEHGFDPNTAIVEFMERHNKREFPVDIPFEDELAYSKFTTYALRIEDAVLLRRFVNDCLTGDSHEAIRTMFKNYPIPADTARREIKIAVASESYQPTEDHCKVDRFLGAISS
jgi:hypothetical protein